MYEKFVALALLLTATVQGQEDDDYSGDVWDQTPEPAMWHDFYVEMTIPDDEFFGEFVNNVDYAGFGLWDDSDNAAIQDWVDAHDFTDASFNEPTGEVFGGTVGFIEEVSELDYHVACIYGPSYDDKAWCTGTVGTDYFTATIDPSDLPEDGSTEWDVSAVGTTQLNAEDFDGDLGAGIGVEFGHSFDPEANEWNVWWWNDGSEGDFIEAEHEVYIVQYDAEGSEFTFSETLDITMWAGASHLAAATIASATVLYALI